VSNFKWGIYSAVFAILISVALGMLFGVKLFDIIIRALIFGAVFFGLGFGLRFVVNNFFPELLLSEEEAAHQDGYSQSGANVDISIDSTGEYAVPELFKTSDDPEEMGNIEDLISGIFRPKNDNQGFAPVKSAAGVDADFETGYNSSGFFQENDGFNDLSVFEKPQSAVQAEEAPSFTPSFGDDSGLAGLPDLDMMARAFSSASFGGSPAQVPMMESAQVMPSSMPPAEELSQAEESFEPERVRMSGNKAETLDGDFDPKSLAEGIRTVLSKDK